MEEADKGRLMTTIDVSGWTFLLVPAHPGCPGHNPDSCKTVVCVCVSLYNPNHTSITAVCCGFIMNCTIIATINY